MLLCLPELLLPSSPVRPDQSLPTVCKAPLSPPQAFGNSIHAGTVTLFLIEKCEADIIALHSLFARTSESIAFNINFSSLNAVKKTLRICRGKDGELFIYVFHFISKFFTCFFSDQVDIVLHLPECLKGIQAASLLHSFFSPRSTIGLLLTRLMQYVSAYHCNGGMESPTDLILQTLEICELINAGVVKDSSEHCHQDHGLYWK